MTAKHNKLYDKLNKQEKNDEEDRTLLDAFKDQQYVDDIPMKDLKIDQQQEDNKKKSQNTSQSEKKYDAEKESFKK